MILDTRTIFLITFFNVLIMGVGILGAAKAYEGQVQRSMTTWGRVCLIVISSLVLMFLFALSGWKLLRPPKASSFTMRRVVCLGFAIMFVVRMN